MTNHKKEINLLNTWLDVELDMPGFNKTAAMEELSAATGRNYNLDQLGKWSRGVKPIPQPAQNYMLKVSIDYALKESGIVSKKSNIEDEQLDLLADMLTPPKR